MIEEIAEMVSRIPPEAILIGFCVFLLVGVIIIIYRIVFGLQLILEETRRVNMNLNDIEQELEMLTYVVEELKNSMGQRGYEIKNNED